MKLTFDGVTAAYRKKRVAEEIRFMADSGQITALLGRNGAGKSTLLSCLMGEKNDYQGRILLNGRNVRELTPGERSCMIACLPQNLPMPHVKVGELAAFGRTPYIPFTGKLSDTDREKVRWALRAVGMEDFEDAFVDTLSGGERKKAFFAMVLAQDTPVVVLDEPTAHLDTVSRFEMLELIRKLCRETGKTFLTVMHEVPEVLRYADKIVVIHEKKQVFQGTPDACLKEKIPERCFRIRITGNIRDGYAVLPMNQEESQ